MNSFTLLSYLSAAAVYVLITIGGYVTSTGSGRACPDWPLCHGQLIPPLTGQILIEYTHRLWTVVTALLVIAMFISFWRRSNRPFAPLVSSSVGLILLVAQVLLGMVTVQSGSAPTIVTAHLALATGLFASLVANAIYASQVS